VDTPPEARGGTKTGAAAGFPLAAADVEASNSARERVSWPTERLG